MFLGQYIISGEAGAEGTGDQGGLRTGTHSEFRYIYLRQKQQLIRG